MFTNKELIENALKRVNALAGTNGKLYKDHLGFCVIEPKHQLFGETTRTATEMLAYLHGLEDAITFGKTAIEVAQKFQQRVDEEMEKQQKSRVRNYSGSVANGMFNW